MRGTERMRNVAPCYKRVSAMSGRIDIDDIVKRLLLAHAEGAVVPLDAVGDAVGARAVTPDDIEQIFSALERAKRSVGSVEGGRGEANLAKVVLAARELRAEDAARKPTAADIAARAALTVDEVRFSLALLRVMQR